MKFWYTNAEHTALSMELQPGEHLGNEYCQGAYKDEAAGIDIPAAAPKTVGIGMDPANPVLRAIFPGMTTNLDESTDNQRLVSLGEPAFPVDDFVPPPAPPIVVNKVDFYDRMTEQEAEDVEALIAQQSVKNRRIFESASTFRSDHELWGLLNALADQVFSAERKKIILAPSF